MINKLPPYMLWLISALSFVLPWMSPYFIPLAFIAFVPLLILENKLRSEQSKHARLYFFLACFSVLLVWNTCTVWWIKNASPEGALMAIIIDALVMSLPLLFYHVQRVKNPLRKPLLPFILFWLGAEYLHSHWQLSFPWLLWGNVFSSATPLIQWYEITGVFGGTLWILWTNAALFTYINQQSNYTPALKRNRIFSLLFWFAFFPIFTSIYLYPHATTTKVPCAEIIAVQPNVDPYKDKFSGISPIEQCKRLLQLSDSLCTPNTTALLMPETAILGGTNEAALLGNESVALLQQFQQSHPAISILSGIDSYKIYENCKARPTLTARVYEANDWYDVYNAAIFMTPNQAPLFYHKSKLVPGVEKMPYPEIFGFLENLAIKLGGSSGSLGSDNSNAIFTCSNKTRLAPVICFESVFSDFVAEKVAAGAQIICILTNDGWWGNTAGYKQHFDFARLRAIENRRWVARSANTGISGFINERGESVSQSEWWTPTALKQQVPLFSEQTFYTRYAYYLHMLLLVLLFSELILLLRRVK